MKLLDYAIMRVYYTFWQADAVFAFLQKKAIFTFQGRIVLYRGERLCNQQTKVAEEINNTVTQRAGTVTFYALINAPDVGHQSRANRAQNSTRPWIQGCVTETA